MFTRREALAYSLAAGLPLPPPSGPAAVVDNPTDDATAAADNPTAATDADDPTRVFTGGRKPTDYRLGPPKTLNDYFPFVPPKTKQEWEARRQRVREQILVATGLWPLPEKTPLNPVIHGRIEREDYTIEKVYFASLPGHYVCGNLYRPRGPATGKRPAVLSPHGHWSNGRFFWASDAAVAADRKRGAETTEEGARSPLQTRCGNLARLGFVVFHYDMVGYADSTAIPHREGFRDAEAELRLQSFMGLQTWNTIRAYDFLESLPDVDPKRIGVTGASGGGTQTFILGAIDDRPAAAFPAVMVSTAMQGGCICENCSGLRVKTGNVEFAALFAPKPLALSCANDWTKEFLSKGFPELRAVYELYGAADKVAARAWLDFPHNFSQPSREFLYSWFSKHLLGRDGPVEEKPVRLARPAELSVFDAEHPRPADELDAARLRRVMTRASDEQLARLTPKDGKSLQEFRRVVGTALRVVVHSELPESVVVRSGPWRSALDGHTLHRLVLGRTDEKDALPCAGLSGEKPGRSLLIWLHPKGKASLVENGQVAAAVRSLTAAGYTVVAPDLLGTGENTLPQAFPVNKEYAGYTYGYNRSLLANRVHDALTAVAYGLGYGRTAGGAKEVQLVGFGEMGVVAVLTRALAGDAVTATAADLNRFRFDDIKDTADPMILPGALKYGGLDAFLGLCAPGRVLAHNLEGSGIGRVTRAAYAAAGAADKLNLQAERLDDARVVAWLLK